MNEILVNVQGLCKQFKKSKVLKDVSFTVKEGMICGLVGPNGAGKTTIMKALGGLVIPTSGSIELFGETSEKGLAHSRSRMSFMIEIPYAKQNMSARENLEKLRLQKGLPDKKRIDEVLEMVGLSDTGKKPVKNFSLGMKQRLGIAGALLTKPELLVLDEPFVGLDPKATFTLKEIMHHMCQRGAAVFFSTHVLDVAEKLCNKVVIIKQGKIIFEGSMEEFTEGHSLEEAFLEADHGK